MVTQTRECVGISEELLEAIQGLPLHRYVEHCGQKLQVSPFEFYALCPRCGERLKLRGFSGVPELEDVFDAVFSWMNQPGAAKFSEQRRALLESEE